MMLCDLVAALVVERARRLAELTDPRKAFTGKSGHWKSGDYTRTVHLWKSEFTGFEMVVASANNGAVENVTNEIPVVVGDPLQLEPITALPFRAEQAIRGDHSVDEQWLSSHTSVQRLADRLTDLGTYLPVRTRRSGLALR